MMQIVLFGYGAAAEASSAEDNGSVEFDGSGDYLTVPSSSDFDFGTGNFTIEGFFNKRTANALLTLLCSNNYYTAGHNGNWILRITSDTTIAFATYDATSNEEYSEFTASNGVGGWHHFALVREGTGTNQTKFYYDGNLCSSMTVSKSLSDAGTNGLRIGEESAGGPGNGEMDGFLSNIRVIKGTALYTSNFTVPTAPLTNVTNTKLLCCQSNTSAIEAAVSPGTIVASGNATAVDDDPFSGATGTNTAGSVEFDGSGDYLTVPSSSDLTFGTGDFTVEMWVYADNFTNRNTFYDSRPSGAVNGMVIGSEVSTGQLKVYMNPSSGNDQIVDSTDFSTGSWYHIAVTCDSTTVRLFVNGVLKDTGTGRDLSNTEPVNIGYKTSSLSSYDYLDGKISNLRVLKGTALYTSNFTVPLSPLTNVTNTKLLCCQSSSSAIEAAVSPGTIVASGNATAVDDDPFTPGSVFFDGTDDHLDITGQSDLAFGTGDFTLEFFVYFAGTDPTLDTIMDSRTSGSATDGFLIGRFHTHTQANTIDFYVNGYAITSDVSVGNDTWTHIAVVREGSDTNLYINGTAATTTYSDSNNYSNDDIVIGDQYANLYPFHGNLSNFRMVKGTAVYTSNFTVPTSLLTNVTNTKLLCCQSSNSATAADVTPTTIVATGASASSDDPF